MFKHIVADAKKIAHQARTLTRTKEAHRLILQLSRPLADITDLINENIAALQRHCDLLEGINPAEKDIELNLFIPKICLQVSELKQPITVCTSAQCCEFYSENNKKQHYYKQKCHDPCFLNNMPEDIIGSSELMYCATMNTQYYCKKCSCHYSKHMHVLYLTRKTEEQVPGEDITQTAKIRNTLETQQKQTVDTIKDMEMEYKGEGETVVKTMARFSHFLTQHGFSTNNDAYEKYLLYLISREVKYGPDADLQLISHYKSMLNDYKEEKASLDAYLTEKSSEECAVSPEEITLAVDRLFHLKHTGQQLKDLHEVQLKCLTSNDKEKAGTSNTEKAQPSRRRKKDVDQ